MSAFHEDAANCLLSASTERSSPPAVKGKGIVEAGGCHCFEARKGGTKALSGTSKGLLSSVGKAIAKEKTLS